MEKPDGVVEQVRTSKLLLDKAYKAHKVYDKAREAHEKAMRKCCDVSPNVYDNPTLNNNQADIEAYKRTRDTKREMDFAREVMAEAYFNYVNHKRKMRSEK